MSVISAPSPPAARTSDPGPIQRAGLATVVVLGPLSITLLRAILPYHTADEAATIAAKVATHQTAQTLQLWLTFVAMVTLIPAVIMVGSLAARRARTLAAWGTALAVAGFSLLFATTAIDFAALAGAQSGLGVDATATLLDSLNNSPLQIVATLAFVVGHIVGVILLGVALLRGRVIPAWAAWALIVSQPLHVVFAVIVPSNPLDAGAWALTTVAFAMAAVTIGRGR
jgi:hypothetical protein